MTNHDLLNAIGQIDDDLLEIAPANIVRFPNAKRFAALIAALVLMCVSITALAYASPDVNEWLHRYWPWFTQALKPINLSCEDNGIRMEVLSGSVEDNEAFVYISMQDLTGHRIDATTDLFDSANLLLPYDGSGTCSMVSFDEETGVATFMIYMRFDTDVIPSGNVTFRTGCFLSGKQTSTVDLTDLIDWDAAFAQQEGIQKTSLAGGFTGNTISTGVDGNELCRLVGQLPVLSSAAAVDLPFADGLTVSALGSMDQVLHLRVTALNNLHTDNHCFLTLADRDGRALDKGCMVYSAGGEAVMDVSRRSWADGENQVNEYFFDLTGIDRDSLRLTAECVTAPPAVSGSWSVTFPMDLITAGQ